MENESLTTDQISDKIVEIDRNINKSRDYLDIVEVERFNLDKQIAMLEIDLKEKVQAIKMAKSNIRRLITEKDIFERLYWNKRG